MKRSRFLEQLLQEGARKLLQAAIENKVIEYLQIHKGCQDENGQRLVVRNGHLPEREITSGIGPIKVRQPRVWHRDRGRFSSAILPRFMRRTPSVDALIPALYLKGILTGDFIATVIDEDIAAHLPATGHLKGHSDCNHFGFRLSRNLLGLDCQWPDRSLSIEEPGFYSASPSQVFWYRTIILHLQST
jgi:hypothetical protein